ncbi:MAG: AAC(3) family N-acetyltransferase [Candidatus Krumholzibacteria bacterium]
MKGENGELTLQGDGFGPLRAGPRTTHAGHDAVEHAGLHVPEETRVKSTIKRIIPKGIRRGVRKVARRLELRRMRARNPSVAKSQLVRDLTALGLETGDLLYVHSSLRALGFVDGGADTVIDALLDTVGPEGTLVFPTFTLVRGMKETLEARDHVFDPESSPSTVGKITNCFRARPGVRRSEHPTHSVAALGPLARELTETHLEEGMNFGKGTPFDKILRHGGKVVGLGVNFSPITFYHVFEEFNPEKFPGVYLPHAFPAKIKVGDNIREVKVRCHDPVFHQQRIDKVPAIESYFSSYYHSEGVAHVGKVGNGSAPSWWIRAADVMQCLDKLYSRGITIYKTPNLD